MWGTATVRGEDDVIVRRLNFDEKYCWKTEDEIDGHRLHSDEDVEGFVAHDWSWLERRTMRNPDNEPFWVWYSGYGPEPFYRLAGVVLWDSWQFGPSWERQYGGDWHEDWWSFTLSFGPIHWTLSRTWNVKR